MRKRKISKKRQTLKIDHIRIVIILFLVFAVLVLGKVIRHNFANLSRAETGSFYLTEEFYGSNTPDGLNFNVHVIFNFDGCDGDVMLYESERHIGGPNGWKGPGNFIYIEQWTASPKFIPNDGESHVISYRGSVNRCPRSPDTLWDEVSCTVTFDTAGYPQVSPADKCTIKNPGEIQPVPFTPPKPKAPTAPPVPTNIPLPESPTDKSSTPRDILTRTPTTSALQPTPQTPSPTSPPKTTSEQTVIQFMGIKLGRLNSSQPLDFVRIIINIIKTLGR